MSSSDNQVVRAAFEKAYPMPFACGWNNMCHEYECIWPEHGGEEHVEAAIEQHNDRYKVWQAPRQAVEVQLPERAPHDDPYIGESWDCGHNVALDECRSAIEAQGLKVAP